MCSRQRTALRNATTMGLAPSEDALVRTDIMAIPASIRIVPIHSCTSTLTLYSSRKLCTAISMAIAPKLTSQMKRSANVKNPTSAQTVLSCLARTTAPTQKLRRLVSASKTIQWHTVSAINRFGGEETTAHSSIASTSVQVMGHVAKTDSVFAMKITTDMIAVFSSL